VIKAFRIPSMCACFHCLCENVPTSGVTICKPCMTGVHPGARRESGANRAGSFWKVSSTDDSVHVRAATVIDAMAQGRTRGLFGSLVAVQISEDEFEANTNNGERDVTSAQEVK
jgi:hypothetical protein